MKIVRMIVKCLVAALFLCLLAAPVGLLFYISDREQSQYQPAPNVELKDFAYGKICAVARRDVEEQITVSGRVVSDGVVFIELSQYKNPYDIRMVVDYGQRVEAGDILGYYKGEPVLADKSGIIKRVSQGSDSYIMLESTDDLVLSLTCTDERLLSCFTGENAKLTTEDGKILTVKKIEEAAGGATILLACENQALTYGAEYDELILKTGRVFPQALMVEQSCVYTHPGEKQYYIRQVEANGTFVAEKEVTLGYTVGGYVCVSGVPEGTWCDSGYKAVIEGGGNG